MMWHNTYSPGESYIRQYPRLRKWINQCVQCQAQGYRPDMPERDDGHEFHNIRMRFPCLPLNEVGLCEVCASENV